MFRDATEQYHQDRRTLQAFSSLLTLVEALATITDQRENTMQADAASMPPITLAAAGEAFAEMTKEVLDCKYVGVFALDPPDDCQRLLGTSGLIPEEAAQLRADANHTPLVDYIDADAIAQLHANQVLLLDLKYRPFMTTRSTHGARYRLVAPMILHGKLIGIFTMAKTDEEYPTVQSAYSSQEMALAKGIAKLAAQLIERVSLLQERAQAQAIEQQLQETTRRYEDCLSTASHELRTPLTTIKGNLQLAQRRMVTLEKHAERSPESLQRLQRVEHPLREALQNFSRLERMVGELLDYSRIQADKFLLKKQPCDLIEVVRNATENACKAMGERKLLISLPPAGTVLVSADKDRIGDVVNNYLTNAHKYSSIARPIEVSLIVEELLARVLVRDEGEGIPLSEQARIWERFYRAPGIETQEYSNADSNLGLGLYLCKEIIELHGGQVGVSSMLGQGATFWFTLDLLQSTDNHNQASPQSTIT